MLQTLLQSFIFLLLSTVLQMVNNVRLNVCLDHTALSFKSHHDSQCIITLALDCLLLTLFYSTVTVYSHGYWCLASLALPLHSHPTVGVPPLCPVCRWLYPTLREKTGGSPCEPEAPQEVESIPDSHPRSPSASPLHFCLHGDRGIRLLL